MDRKANDDRSLETVVGPEPNIWARRLQGLIGAKKGFSGLMGLIRAYKGCFGEVFRGWGGS